eukprot:3068854-Pleurochrysis_carterae.AAC.1
MADHSPLWLLPRIREALATSGAEKVTFAQCALGARARKYTTVAHAAALGPLLGALREAQCTHGADKHPEVAYGRDQAGRAMAAQSAAYPQGMNDALAEALASAAGGAPRDGGGEVPDGGGGQRGGLRHEPGGRLVEGAELAGGVRATVAAARLAPAPFASTRNLEPEEGSCLAREALPGDLREPQPLAREGKRAR